MSNYDLYPSSYLSVLSTKQKGFIQQLIYLFLKSSNTNLKKLFGLIADKFSGASLNDINLLCFELAKNYGISNNAMPIENLDVSLSGNPENVFYVDKRAYTISMLNSYCQYAYCCKYMNFEKIHSIMELGSGFGKQVEVIKKLHPHITFYLFDLVPLTYICEQYLASIFPNDLVSYRKTRNLTSIDDSTSGKIYVFGNWKISEISNLHYEMFWNSASIQEIEPKQALNYLKIINSQTSNFIFLNERMEGTRVASSYGKRGMIEQTLLSHYKEGLENFKLHNLTSAMRIPRLSTSDYSYSFWKKIERS